MRGLAALAGAALLLAAAVAALAEPPWPMVRREASARAALGCPGGAPLPEWHYARLTDRKYRPGVPVWTSPALAVVDGTPLAFLGGCDHALTALDLAAKERRWSRMTNGPILDAPVVGLVRDEPIVYFSSADRSVYACLARDGTRLWSRELVAPTTTLGDSRFSSPLLIGDLLVVSGFTHDKALPRSRQTGRLYGLAAETGIRRFEVEVSQGPVGSPAGRVIDGRSLVFAAAQKGLLSCVDVTERRPSIRWRYQMPHEVLGAPCLAAAGGRELLFLGSKYGNLVALDARTGGEVWKRMAGNWIDNTVCAGEIGGRTVVYAGSHDYKVHAFDAGSGEPLFTRALGGEVFAAPAFFSRGGRPALAVACLDNHAYVLDASTGEVLTSYFTGTPIWDKVAKGDVQWGSPAVVEAAGDEALVLGSYSGTVYVLPVTGECSLRTRTWSPASLWLGLLWTAGAFLLVVLPATLLLSRRRGDRRGA
ncbi:MAG: PQQ-binding-like beta-propeller repeat protein [Planctomycetes bacterium]|jgi:outer membrane protein assembly factor BamB|nr:PQQ-binding-like beta-propeller repeat protein [Planctomycetota bacterium]